MSKCSATASISRRSSCPRSSREGAACSATSWSTQRSASACARKSMPFRCARSRPRSGLRVDKLRITGGRALQGEVRVSGAKNAALPIMCAALLTDERVALANVPSLVDVSTMAKLLRQMGVEVDRPAPGQLTLRAAALRDPTAPYELVKTMRASVMVPGPLLENAAREPEVVDLARCLSAMGARIEGAGSDVVRIQGVASLRGTEHRVMPDRIELGTYLVATAAAGGKVRLTDAAPDLLDAPLEKLRESGARIAVADRANQIDMAARPRAVSLRTAPYPGFATDLQAQFMALATIASGTALITETIFENRFMHALELQRLGAQISIQGNTAVVKGVERLQGASVMATDLRASAGLVIAALVAEGQSVVDRIYHLDRGYEALDKKLAALGARIERIQ